MLEDHGNGSGSRLPTSVLVLSGCATLGAVLVSAMSIVLQLKSYRKPLLQRMVVRIMVMVPLYAVSSLISLFSMEAAFVIDAIRDIYEAFVIYCFFSLLLSYLGGERSLLILLHGRPPKTPPFPASLFQTELDVSDPYTFLFLKRGILQYVQVKPILAVATLILKACGKYNEGDFRANSGYLYVSIIYNTSICLSLYCLAMFWLCVSDDLKPFRPVPKFLCVKGILFFSFWQSIGISILVAAGAIKRLGPYTDAEHISVGLTDTLICLEMPFFAVAHMFAFSYTDFIDPYHTFVARMPFYYAFRDAFGIRDVIEDSQATLRGEGMDYREFEPSEGFMHQGVGRDRRIRAGLRYSKGGKQKYWLPRPAKDAQPPGHVEQGIKHAVNQFAGTSESHEVHAPLLGAHADVVHDAQDLRSPDEEPTIWDEQDVEDGYELPFGDLSAADEELFAHSKRYLFGDYNYPCVDVSTEAARIVIWDEEERVLRDERGAWFSPIRGAKGKAALMQRDGPVWQGYGATGSVKGRAERNDKGGRDYRENKDASRSTSAQTIWTKTTSRSHSPQRMASPTARPSRNEDSSPHDRTRSPPSMAQRPSRNLLSPQLRTDAVDLVVEDQTAAQANREQERRKGEPAVGGSTFHKVYKHHFNPEDSDMHDTPEGGPHAERRIIEEVNDDQVPSPTELEGRAIVRAITPPTHARVEPQVYSIPDDDNPWA